VSSYRAPAGIEVANVAARPRVTPEVSVPTENLSTVFAQLNEDDPANTFIVRGIGRLGFRSREILKRHYSIYGDVSRVLVPTSHGKVGDDPFGRVRPAALGFVVMKDASAVQTILRQGEQQQVAGHVIRVKHYEPTAPTSPTTESTSMTQSSTASENLSMNIPCNDFMQCSG